VIFDVIVFLLAAFGLFRDSSHKKYMNEPYHLFHTTLDDTHKKESFLRWTLTEWGSTGLHFYS